MYIFIIGTLASCFASADTDCSQPNLKPYQQRNCAYMDAEYDLEQINKSVREKREDEESARKIAGRDETCPSKEYMNTFIAYQKSFLAYESAKCNMEVFCVGVTSPASCGQMHSEAEGKCETVGLQSLVIELKKLNHETWGCKEIKLGGTGT